MKSDKEINGIVKEVMDVLRKNNMTKFETFSVLETIKLIIYMDMQKNLEESE